MSTNPPGYPHSTARPTTPNRGTYAYWRRRALRAVDRHLIAKDTDPVAAAAWISAAKANTDRALAAVR